MKVKNCRICNSKKIKTILDYGKVALSGSFIKKNQIKKEIKYPLKLIICLDCKHTQINFILKPDILFKNYFWETGVSSQNIMLIKNLIDEIKKISNINKNTNIIEIASNDGSCLKMFKEKFDCQILGVDPAINLAKKANLQKIHTIDDFFSLKLANKILNRFKLFDLCIARNVIAHLKDPIDVFYGIKKILSKNGILIIEVPHLLNIYKFCQYDNVFHEHVGFHSLRSINDLSRKVNLNLFDVKLINSQGGSIRCYLSNNMQRKKSLRVEQVLKREKNIKLFHLNTWKAFEKKVQDNKNKILILLKKLKKQNKSISIYGASGKGQVLLQSIKDSNLLFDRVYDKSKKKKNYYTPGTHIKIFEPNFINIHKPDYLFVCSWNIYNEIKKEQKKYINNGGKFILPFPNPRIL